MKKILAVLAVLVSVSSAHAADKAWNVGALVGYGVGENSFSGFTYGAEVNYMLNPDWSAGLYWTMTKKTTLGVDTTLMPIMLQVNYHLADMKGLYIGPRLGIVSSKTGAFSSSDFTIGAQVGDDFMISNDWSIGIEANWNLIMATSSSSFFNFVAPIKYHF